MNIRENMKEPRLVFCRNKDPVNKMKAFQCMGVVYDVPTRSYGLDYFQSSGVKRMKKKTEF